MLKNYNLDKNIIFSVVVMLIAVSTNFGYVKAQVNNIELTDIRVQQLENKSVMIRWQTNVATRGKVLYGLNSSGLSAYITDSNTASVNHEIIIGNLAEETDYYYQIIAWDEFEEVRSFVNKFRTGEFHDSVPPRVTNVRVPYIAGTLAVITWDTDEEANSVVEFDEFETFARKAVDNRRVTDHEIVLRNLKINTRYSVRLYSVDKDNNKSGVWYKQFTTLPQNISTEDLEFSRLRPSSPSDPNITDNSITVSLRTNHYARGRITLRGAGIKTQVREMDYETEHLTVFEGLLPGTGYTAYIDMTDIFGKRRTAEMTMTTRQVEVLGISNENEINMAAISSGPVLSGVSLSACSAADISAMLGASGYFGQYYNLPLNAPGLSVDRPEGVARETGWYDNKYFVFSRTDGHIDFGDQFFPVNQGEEGDPHYFSVYWRAILEVPTTRVYNYTITSDDDSWVFIDGKLVTDMPGIHKARKTNESLTLTGGLHGLEIYFAERKPRHSHFSFTIDPTIAVHPWSHDCAPSNINPAFTVDTSDGDSASSGGNGSNSSGVVVAGIEYSYNALYTRASALYKTSVSPDVYSILNGQSHYISSPASFTEYGYRWEDVRTISQAELSTYPRARLIKSPESPVIYYLYQRPEDKWFKIALLSPTVFVSYPDNYWGNVVTVTRLDVDSYPDARLITTADSDKIYFIEDNMKHYVSDEIFRDRGYNMWEVVEVSRIHFDTYKEGTPLE